MVAPHPQHFLEFMQVGSFLINRVLQSTVNNRQNLLLYASGDGSPLSPYSFSYVFMDSKYHLFMSTAVSLTTGLFTCTLASIFSNDLILGTVELLGCFSGFSICGIMFHSLWIERVPRRIASSASSIHTCSCAHTSSPRTYTWTERSGHHRGTKRNHGSDRIRKRICKALVVFPSHILSFWWDFQWDLSV